MWLWAQPCAKGDCYLVAEIVRVLSGVSNKRTKASRHQNPTQIAKGSF